MKFHYTILLLLFTCMYTLHAMNQQPWWYLQDQEYIGNTSENGLSSLEELNQAYNLTYLSSPDSQSYPPEDTQYDESRMDYEYLFNPETVMLRYGAATTQPPIAYYQPPSALSAFATTTSDNNSSSTDVIFPTIPSTETINQNRTYTCQYGCETIFADNTSRQRHERLKHGNRRLRCSYCDQTFNKNETRDDHVQTFHPNQQSSWGVFQMEKKSPSSQSNSLYSSQQDPVDDESGDHDPDSLMQPHAAHANAPSPASITIKDNTDLSFLDQTLKAAHQVEKIYECHLCKEPYGRSSSLRAHMNRIHSLSIFFCRHCQQVFDQKDTKAVHQKLCLPRTCTTCEQTFANLSTLRQHQKECIKPSKDS